MRLSLTAVLIIIFSALLPTHFNISFHLIVSKLLLPQWNSYDFHHAMTHHLLNIFMGEQINKYIGYIHQNQMRVCVRMVQISKLNSG